MKMINGNVHHTYISGVIECHIQFLIQHTRFSCSNVNRLGGGHIDF